MVPMVMNIQQHKLKHSCKLQNVNCDAAWSRNEQLIHNH